MMRFMLLTVFMLGLAFHAYTDTHKGIENSNNQTILASLTTATQLGIITNTDGNELNLLPVTALRWYNPIMIAQHEVPDINRYLHYGNSSRCITETTHHKQAGHPAEWRPPNTALCNRNTNLTYFVKRLQHPLLA